MNQSIASKKQKVIFNAVVNCDINRLGLAKALKISRNTVKRYVAEFSAVLSQYPESDFINVKALLKKQALPSARLTCLLETFSHTVDRMNQHRYAIQDEWASYKQKHKDGYQRSQYIFYFRKWCKANKVSDKVNQHFIDNIGEEVLTTLKQWRRSSNRLRWEASVAILATHDGFSLEWISKKIERSTSKVRNLINAFKAGGLESIHRKVRKQAQWIVDQIAVKKSNLMSILHEAPKLHGINRASWSLDALAEAYCRKFGATVSTSSLSEYIHELGYSFRKAKQTLTSPDPMFREKLANIKRILSSLGPMEKFFSVDEFGPFAVKIKGGRSYVRNGERKTYPQMQRSKGCLICTSALELSTNQITHFYSLKKNTDEMIRLLETLLTQYKGQEKIYFSWDAASWHASKKLYQKISEVNDEGYRKEHRNPRVELAPLPSSAQFLNVIESVFSGLAKAVIHNSDYQSVDECKGAIDRYFIERNEYFSQYPQRAGKKIWGDELVIPVFDETNNCKDPKWR